MMSVPASEQTIAGRAPVSRPDTTPAHPVSNPQRAAENVSIRPRSSFWRRFRRHRLALLGSCLLAVLVLAAALAPVLATHDPNRIDLRAVAQAPSTTHWLGTDLVGRDVYSRLLFAGRVSLSVGLISVAIYIAIAIAIGGTSGYFGGWVDSVLMRFTDIVMCFPTLVIIISVVAIVGPSLWTMMIVIGVLGWPWDARLARGQTLSIREMEFVQAARCMGAPTSRIIIRHVLPSMSGPLIVAATFGVAWTILLEATLSFLGLGVQEPTPSWGNMLNAARAVDVIENMPWMWLPAGAIIAVSVLSINFIGDGLRDALDPRAMNR